MEDWTSGYVSDIEYTLGYYSELNPISAKLAFLQKGLKFPRIRNACELGFGQGLSVLVHGASQDTQWYGTDFNPTQAVFAQTISKEIGSRLELTDDSFKEYLERNDLPKFDYICLHGIWSWISPENRSYIVKFIRKNLRLGGVVYISYNALPGYSQLTPLRHILTAHAAAAGAGIHGLAENIRKSIEFTERLIDAGATTSAVSQPLKERFESIKNSEVKYLAHEYFNADWRPFYFSEVAKELEGAKLSFASPCSLLEGINKITFTEEQLELIDGINDTVLEQGVKDFIINQGFRRDYWVRGAQRMSPTEQVREFDAMNFLLVKSTEEFDMKVQARLGECDLHEDIYAPILEVFEKSPLMSISELKSAVSEYEIDPTALFQAILILNEKRMIRPVSPDHNKECVKNSSDKLNRSLIEKSLQGNKIDYLASPAVGGGVKVDQFEILFLNALNSGIQDAIGWSDYAWDHFHSRGQKIIQEGKTLESVDENKKFLQEAALKFEGYRLPLLKRLCVA